MNNKRATKRALLTSVVALVMCVVMLVGTTFAWFTDTASTGVNKIQAGNLKVSLVDKNGDDLTGKTIRWTRKAASGKGTETIDENGLPLWEPGATYRTEQFYIRNDGNLALKYKVSVNGFEGDTKLLDVLDFTVLLSGANVKNEDEIKYSLEALADYEGYLLPESAKTSATDPEIVGIKITAKMKESAGNEYQGLSLDGIGITVVATQYTYEKDSIDNKYDKDATYPVASAAEMKEALANGGIVSVTKDIKTDNIGDTVDDRVIISNPTTLNLDAKIITPDDMGNNNTNFCALIVDADTTINAGKNGGINTGKNGAYAINVRNGANLTITSGDYYGGGTAVQVQKGTLTITGGHFAVEAFGEPYGYNFLLNCVDAAYKNGTAKISVMGGTFVNFDPSNNAAEGAGTNFVADGYKVVSETQTNGDVWYTVVKA